ncbi:MAG: hypothetical protein KC518_01850 [Candidatus Cloacimonetes bacterium]|nr:hypothetical protein [Candidatus Cloacimonadota bacterium]
MKKYTSLAILAGLGLLLVSCGDEDSIPGIQSHENSSTSAQTFGNYAAIGNSLTAGYQSGAWGNPEHIEYSFPNQLAKALGINDFDQVVLGGTGVSGTSVSGVPVGGNQILNFNAQGQSSVAWSDLDPNALQTLMGGTGGTPIDFLAPRNFGIPGITLAAAALAPLSQVAAAIPFTNMYLTAASAGISQVDLVAQESDADFITCWLGNNDVLGYVTSGGVGAAAGGQNITEASTFGLAINYTLNAFSAVPYVCVMNVPDVTDIPFVSYPNQALMAAGVTSLYGSDLQGNIVPVNLATDFVLLSGLSLVQAGAGSSVDNPLGPQYVLSATEAALAQDAVDTFNDLIQTAVSGINTARGGALPPVLYIDMNGYFNEIVSHGLEVGDNLLTVTYGSGGIFSLDGVHPSSIGYAAVANRIIQGMNDGWDRSIEEIDIASLFGVAPGL